eukprot:1153036-Pelagomonas_calceolata.AAC.1
MHNELHVVGWSLRSNSKSGHQVSVSAKMHVYLSSQAETAVEYIKEFLSKLQVRHMSFSKGTLGVKRDTPDLAVLREYGHVRVCQTIQRSQEVCCPTRVSPGAKAEVCMENLLKEKTVALSKRVVKTHCGTKPVELKRFHATFS